MSIKEYKLILRHISSTLFIGVTLLLLLGGAIYMTQKVLATRSKITSSQNEIADLNKKAANVLTNTTISQDDIDQYTQLLSQLIPENEDVFSIMLALENLSIKTGYNIIQYQVSPSKQSEKFTLQIEGIGDSAAFLNFVKSYSFAGGRYITSNSVSYDSNDKGSSTLNLSFYSHKTSSLSTENKKLSLEDIELLKRIQSKTEIIVKDTGVEISTTYPTKSNPF